MHPIPTRIALASSVLVLGSVGTVSAVSLQSSPSPLERIPGTPQALSPPGSSPRLPAAGPAEPVPVTPDMHIPAPSEGASGGSAVDAGDLINIATSPLRSGAVAVPVDDVARPVRHTVKQVAKQPRRVVRQTGELKNKVRDEVDSGVDKAVRKAVNKADDRHQAKKARQIGNKFGREMARDMAGRFGGEIARQAVSRQMESHGEYQAGYRAMTAGWSGEYVGRHRAE